MATAGYDTVIEMIRLRDVTMIQRLLPLASNYERASWLVTIRQRYCWAAADYINIIV